MNEKVKQNVKVYIRERPFTDSEIDSRQQKAIHQMTSREIILKQGYNEKKYIFDEVFSAKTSQAEVYKVVVSPLIDYTISGYNCTVFAYGQTGTGKTHTMIGANIGPDVNFATDPAVGMIPRAAAHLFSQLSKLDTKIEYSVKVSFIEIYNEEVRDLLTTEGPPLRIYEDPENRGSVCMKGLKEATVYNTLDVNGWLNIGNLERQTAATNLNRQSSRSHTLFTLLVHTREITVDGEELIKSGKLHLVDLAGSENIGRSGATDVRAREAGTINKSLLTLGKVIKALAQKAQHVPYRDSKLTRILQDSLGGKTKTCMIATINPCVSAWDETISTLEYANVARCVANCPQINMNRKQANILKDFKEEIHKLQQELAAARTGEGFYISHDNYNKMDQERIQNNERICELMRQISNLEEMHDYVKAENEQLNESFARNREYLAIVEENLKDKENEVKKTEFLLKYFDKRDAKISSTAKQLLNVCDTATKHEDILHNKYQNQCKVTLENAAIAKNLSLVSTNTLKSLENSNDAWSKSQQNCYEKIREASGQLEEVHNRNLDDLHTVEAETDKRAPEKLSFNVMAHDRDDDLYTDDKVEGYFVRVFREMEKEKVEAIIKAGICYLEEFQREKCGDENTKILHLKKKFEAAKSAENELIEKQKQLFHERGEQYEVVNSFLSLIKNNLGPVLAAHAEVCKIDEQIDSLKVEQESAELVSKLEDDFNAYHAFHEEVSEQRTELIANLHQSACRVADDIQTENARAQKYLAGFRETVDENLRQINTRVKASWAKIGKNTRQIKERILTVGLRNTEEINRLAEKCAEADRSHNADLKQYTRQNLEHLRRYENGIIEVTHAGDTPMKQLYEYPRSIVERLPQQVLLDRFNGDSPNVSFNEGACGQVHDETGVENGLNSTSSTP